MGLALCAGSFPVPVGWGRRSLLGSPSLVLGVFRRSVLSLFFFFFFGGRLLYYRESCELGLSTVC